MQPCQAITREHRRSRSLPAMRLQQRHPARRQSSIDVDDACARRAGTPPAARGRRCRRAAARSISKVPRIGRLQRGAQHDVRDREQHHRRRANDARRPRRRPRARRRYAIASVPEVLRGLRVLVGQRAHLVVDRARRHALRFVLLDLGLGHLGADLAHLRASPRPRSWIASPPPSIDRLLARHVERVPGLADLLLLAGDRCRSPASSGRAAACAQKSSFMPRPKLVT